MLYQRNVVRTSVDQLPQLVAQATNLAQAAVQCSVASNSSSGLPLGSAPLQLVSGDA